MLTWTTRRDLPAIDGIDGGAIVVQSLMVNPRTISMVWREDGTDVVLGYVVYTIEKSSVTINRIVVHSEYRRQGIGTAIVGGLLQKPLFARKRLRAYVTNNEVLQFFFRAGLKRSRRLEDGRILVST